MSVEEVAVDSQRALQDADSEENEVVQTLLCHAAHPPFRVRVGIGGAKGRLHHLRLGRGQDRVEVPGQQLVPIMQYEPRGDCYVLAGHQQVARHLSHPAAMRAEGSFRQQDTARAQVQHEQDIGRPEPTVFPTHVGVDRVVVQADDGSPRRRTGAAG